MLALPNLLNDSMVCKHLGPCETEGQQHGKHHLERMTHVQRLSKVMTTLCADVGSLLQQSPDHIDIASLAIGSSRCVILTAVKGFLGLAALVSYITRY
jgi:hypothetical protein